MVYQMIHTLSTLLYFTLLVDIPFESEITVYEEDRGSQFESQYPWNM